MEKNKSSHATFTMGNENMRRTKNEEHYLKISPMGQFNQNCGRSGKIFFLIFLILMEIIQEIKKCSRSKIIL